MKKIQYTLSGILIICMMFSVSLFLTSCSEEEIQNLVNQAPDNTPVPTPDNSIPIPDWTDASGVLVATKVKSIQMGIAIDIGVASAVFYDVVGDTSFANAGEVKCQSTALTKHDNNAYVFAPTQTDPTGLSFSSTVSWNVEGAGNVSAFTHDLTGAFPDSDSITSSTSIDRNSAYTLSSTGVTNADSVLFIIAGGSGTPLIKYKAGNTITCDFTAAEMATLPAGPGIIQIVPMKIVDSTFGGRKNYFIRQTSVSKMVTITE